MKLTIVGSGYVGLVSAACFSEMGNQVVCHDTDLQKIELLKKGVIPIYEPGLEEIVRRNSEKGNLEFTIDRDRAYSDSGVIFIAVGTPMGNGGYPDLSYVESCARTIGRYITRDIVVVNKSTVPVGSADKVSEWIHEELEKKGVSFGVDVVSNPEFLKEGSAIKDFMSPDRIIIGTNSERACGVMEELYSPFMINRRRFHFMDARSSEMTKYAANALLATKISFINEMAAICENVGADVNNVRLGVGSDSRIGYNFLYPGVGFGGSCFPKDVRALERIAEDSGVDPVILKAVQERNRQQKEALAGKVITHFGSDLSGHTFAIWGLTFKPDTDDMREAPSLTVIRLLAERGARFKSYDPQGASQFEDYFKDLPVEPGQDKYTILEGASALLLLTEWREFRTPDFNEIKGKLNTPIIFDGRNQYTLSKLPEKGFLYYPIGVGEGVQE